jgi:hypothetical protein
MAVANGRSIGYQDSFFSAVDATANNADLTYEAFRTAGRFNVGCFRRDQDNKIYVAIQFNHNRRPGSPIADVHVHVVPMVAPAADRVVYFRINYVWVGIGEVIPAPTSWDTNQTQMDVLTTDGFKHILHVLVTNIPPPATEGPSSFLLCEVIREGATEAGDTFDDDKAVGTASANLALLGVDAHYEVDRDGSLTEDSY